MLSVEEKKAIDSLRERLRQSIVRGDVHEYVACFAENGVIMHPGTPQVRGHAAKEEYAASFFDNVKVPTLNLTLVTLAGEGRYAYEVATQECEVEPAMPGSIASDSIFTSTREAKTAPGLSLPRCQVTNE